MAANSLGHQHSAYAVSLQNLGLYYDAIENDTSKANEFFAQELDSSIAAQTTIAPMLSITGYSPPVSTM